MMRELIAMTQVGQVRVWTNMLTREDFLPSSFGCVSTQAQKSRGFAQSALINIDSHDVVGGL